MAPFAVVPSLVPLTRVDSSQVNTRARTVDDAMHAQSELVTVQAKLRDWTSLIPSCLVVQKKERPRPHVTSYNCELGSRYGGPPWSRHRGAMEPASELKGLANGARPPLPVLLRHAGAALPRPHAPADAAGQDDAGLQSAHVVSRGARRL